MNTAEQEAVSSMSKIFQVQESSRTSTAERKWQIGASRGRAGPGINSTNASDTVLVDEAQIFLVETLERNMSAVDVSPDGCKCREAPALFSYMDPLKNKILHILIQLIWYKSNLAPDALECMEKEIKVT